MADSTIALVISAIVGIGTITALIMGAYAALITARRVERKVDAVEKIGAENHKMLNQDRTDRLNYQRALIRALEGRGIPVPIDQSAPEEVKLPELARPTENAAQVAPAPVVQLIHPVQLVAPTVDTSEHPGQAPQPEQPQTDR